MTRHIHALLVDDDERLVELTARYLGSHGIDVAVPGDAAEAVHGAYDCVILDVELAGRDGIEVCRELRAASDCAILLVGARADEDTRIRGLEAGADDFVAKPFSPRELVARIVANVRRARREMGPVARPIHVGSLTVDPGSMSVTLDQQSIAFTSREFAVLRTLAERAGSVVTRDDLLAQAMGSSELAFERSIDALISRVRSKLGDDSRAPRRLKTVRRTGYMLTA